MTHPTPTVFGAPADDLGRIAVALRAVASRHGIELQDADPLDVEAAAVAATLWCAATGVDSFAEVPLAGPYAADTLSKVLMRAAGQPVPSVLLVQHHEVAGDAVACAVESVLELLRPEVVPAVMEKAAADLCLGGGQLSAAAEMLALQVPGSHTH